MAFARILTFSFLLCALAKAEFDNNQADNGNKDNNVETQLLKQEYPITWNSYNVIATSVALVVVAAGVTALAALIWPLIAYKACYFFGSCDQNFFAYVDMIPHNLQQKRSLDQLDPIFRALSRGYEKYGTPETKKNSSILSWYKK